MKFQILILALSILVFASGCSLLQPAGKGNVSSRSDRNSNENSTATYAVNFEKGDMLDPVLKRAKKEGKLVFLDFRADWCAPCKMMEQRVFTDKGISEFMNENFVNFKIDADGDGSHLLPLYDVKNIPTLLFVDANGDVLVRKDGAAFHAELRTLGEKAITKAGGHSSIRN